MSTRINVETFLAVIRKSGLVERERLETVLRELQGQFAATDDAQAISDRLIAENVITKWQAEKLLQGKHRGYFLGKYKLLSLLGKGGMSSVYLAEHLLLRRRCALKVLPAKRVDDSSYLERFHREAQAVASLDHPNIVRAYDVDHQTDGDRQIHFLVMEFVDGQSLQELVSEHGVLSFFDAAEFTRQAALGLKQAHEQGMIHRDIKPGNLLVDTNGVVKILDLGLAKFFMVEEGNDALTIRHDEKVLGTADYLSPEQAIDSHTVDVRADIYSLGCTLYFMVTGQPPFTEGTLAQRLMAHQLKTPPAVESLRPDTPPSLVKIIRKMMEKQPGDRYATADETEKALFAWIDENADDHWRREHSDVYGSRSSDTGTSRKPVPVALPVGVKPQVESTAAPVKAPAAKPVSSLTKLPKTAPVQPAVLPETAIDPFFAKPMQPPPEAASTKIESGQRTTIPEEPAAKPVVSDEPPQIVVAPALTTNSNAETPFPQFPSPFAQLDTLTPAKTPAKSASKSKPSLAKSGSVKVSVGKGKSRGLPLWMDQIKQLTPKQWAGIAAAILVVLFGVIYSVGGFDGSASSKPPKPPPVIPFPKDKREVTVGPSKAEYSKIRDALIAVRDRYRPHKDSQETFTIKVAAGTYNELIRIDGRSGRWPEGVILLGDGEVHLEGPGDEPIIRVANASRFVLENLDIAAKERKVAVELSGDLHETRIGKLTVRGFSEVGILCKGAQGLSFGTNQLMLDQLTLEPAGTQAVGIRFEESSDTNVESIVVRGCRFLGPMSAGIEFQDQSPYSIDVTECIFSKTLDGIRVNNQPMVRSLHITNNSFRQIRNGIRFAKLPKESSMDLAFRRNLLIATEHAELTVQSGYDEGKFKAMLSTKLAGIESNWSDRQKAELPYDDEILLFFDRGGRQGEKNLELVSLDPNSPKFLVPAENSPLKKVDGAQGTDKQWVGAMGP